MKVYLLTNAMSSIVCANQRISVLPLLPRVILRQTKLLLAGHPSGKEGVSGENGSIQGRKALV